VCQVVVLTPLVHKTTVVALLTYRDLITISSSASLALVA